jgi:hypothetical protein
MIKKPFKIISILLCVLLCIQQSGFAQVAATLDIAGNLAALHNNIFPDKFRPLHLRYISYDSLNNNFKLLLDKGDTKNPKIQDIEVTTKDLLNYFFTGIALPNGTFWVNLRPDSPNDIIDPLLAQTDVGRILLESDLQLKKDAAKATSPETPEGKEYWDKLYQKAGELYGSDNITIPTLTRPWIVPDEIIIRESTDSAYVYKATLKVMLEQDYLKGDATYSFKDPKQKELNDYSSQLIREKILPKLTKEINNAKRYAPLRQVYYSLILAQWFKARNSNKNTQYARFIDRRDLSNLQSKTPYSVNTYFTTYKENFAKGEYNLSEPIQTLFGQTVRSYFSGGITNIAPVIPSLGQPARVDAMGTRITVAPVVNDPGVNNPNLVGMQVQATNNPGEIVMRTDQGQGITPFVSSSRSVVNAALQKQAARLLLEHMRYVLESSEGITNVDDINFWRRLLMALKQHRPSYKVNIDVGNNELLREFSRLYFETFRRAKEITSDEYIDSAANHRKMVELLETDLGTSQQKPLENHDIHVVKSGLAEGERQEQVRSLLTTDIAEFIVMLHNGHSLSKLIRQRELILQKASNIDLMLRDYLERILAYPEVQSESLMEQLALEVARLNEEFLAKPEIGFYLETSSVNGRLLVIPYAIEHRRKYQLPDGRETEVLYLHQIALNISWAKKGHNAVGEKFVCISRDSTGNSVEDITRVLNGGRYYATGGRQHLSNIENLAKMALLKDFSSMDRKTIQAIIEFCIELHGQKHNEGDINGTTERLKQYSDGKIINEVLAHLTGLALGPATYYQLIEILEGVASPQSTYYPSVYILNELSEALGINIRCGERDSGSAVRALLGKVGINIRYGETNSDSAIRIVKNLLEKDRAEIKRAAEQAYRKYAKQVGAGEINEGAIKLAVNLGPDFSEDHAAEGNVTKEDVQAIAKLADALGLQGQPLPQNVLEKLESVFGPGRTGNPVVVVVPQAQMLTRDNVPINGPVRLGNKIFVGDQYLSQHGNDLGVIIAKLGHEAMAQWIAERRPDLNQDAHQIALEMETILKVDQGQQAEAGAEKRERSVASPINPEKEQPFVASSTVNMDNIKEIFNIKVFQNRIIEAFEITMSTMREARFIGHIDSLGHISFGKVYKGRFGEAPTSDDLSSPYGAEQKKATLDIHSHPPYSSPFFSFGDLDQESDMNIVIWQNPESKGFSAFATIIGPLPKEEIERIRNQYENWSLQEMVDYLAKAGARFYQLFRDPSSDQIEFKEFTSKDILSASKSLSYTWLRAIEFIRQKIASEMAGFSSDEIFDKAYEIYTEARQGYLGSINARISLRGRSDYKVKSDPTLTPERIRHEIMFYNAMLDGVIGALGKKRELYMEQNPNSDLLKDSKLTEIQRDQEEILGMEQELNNESEKLIKALLSIESIVASDLTQKAIPVNNGRQLGGIDFRFLPIVTQSMDSLKASIRAMPQASLQRINLTQEWSDIERLVSSGIAPSAERLKDYLAASCFKGNLDSDMNKIVSCISDILRMEEETCCSTDPTLKDILVVLGSGRSGKELKAAFSGVV